MLINQDKIKDYLFFFQFPNYWFKIDDDTT